MRMESEIWRDIKGYEGIYQVSSWGRIKELDHINDKGIHRREKLLRKIPYISKGRGLVMKLPELVAETFPELIDIVEQPDDEIKERGFFKLRYQIYHKDGNVTNNHVDNLYYKVDFPETIGYPYDCYCVETGICYTYQDAKKATGALIKDIKEAQKSKKLTAGGYHWEIW